MEYRTKIRPLRVKTIDESIKTLLVDDSCTVAELIKMIAAKIGLTNSDEYALISEDELEKPFKKGKVCVHSITDTPLYKSPCSIRDTLYSIIRAHVA